MGDSDDIMEMAENLDMNNYEKDRYEEHIAKIKSLEHHVIFWRLLNVIFQVIFFWNIVALALELAETYSGQALPAVHPFFEGLNHITAGVTFWFGILSAFAFFLMIWTGIVRAKWEGRLTRASAYALAFISNIEHRDYTDKIAQGVQQLRARRPVKVQPVKPISRPIPKKEYKQKQKK